MLPSAARLVPIPIVDVGDEGPVRHAIEGRARARALRDECVDWIPRVARGLLPAIDLVTRRWLLRSRSPYAAEVHAIAGELGFSGIWFLNGCYQWGCTAFACEQGGAPWLVRTLDWPFPGLGRHLEVARMQGVAGDFDNVTWPAYVGVLTASAPERFAGCINQAPMWRRTRRPWLRPYDIALNARVGDPRHSARPSAARSVRDLQDVRGSEASSGDDADCPSRNLHVGWLPPG